MQVRGDNGIEGSSPLTRGKHGSEDPYGLSSRLIPAHAGKTGTPFRWLCGKWAHPRSRGENSEG